MALMHERLTIWKGQNADGTPRAAFAKEEGHWPDILQECLVKLAKYEDRDEQGCKYCKDAIPIDKKIRFCPVCGREFGEVSTFFGERIM